MAIANYRAFMSPVLHVLSDGKPRPLKQVRDLVAAREGVSVEERAAVIKSGVSIFDNRVNWAVTYMAQAGLLTRPRRAILQITDRGQKVLREHPEHVDNHVLEQFQEFQEFKARARNSQQDHTSQNDEETISRPPREVITGRSRRTTLRSRQRCSRASSNRIRRFWRILSSRY